MFVCILALIAPPCDHTSSPKPPEVVWSTKLQNTKQWGKKNTTGRFQPSESYDSDVWILPCLKPQLFTLNRRLVSDTSDVCFSVNLHYNLAGRDSDVWTRLTRRLNPVTFVFLGFGPGFLSERFLRPYPTFVTCLYAVVDHSILVLMDFYALVYYDHLLTDRFSIASSIELCYFHWFQILFK